MSRHFEKFSATFFGKFLRFPSYNMNAILQNDIPVSFKGTSTIQIGGKDMKHGIKQNVMLAIGFTLLLIIGVADQASAYQVTLSLYNQGFDINKFYNNGDFNVEAGIVNADPTSLLVIVGDPANVEDVFETPDQATTFELLAAGSDFHFEIAQPFRFQDRFDGLFSTTVDDPLLFVPDNATITAFRDDGLLADDRIDLSGYEAELPPMYVEVDYGDTITLTTDDGTKLFITHIWRNDDFTVTFDISDVPEPGTVVLIGIGLVGIVGMVRRKKMIKKNLPFLNSLFITILLITSLFSVYSYAWSPLDIRYPFMLLIATTNQDKLGNCTPQDGPLGLFFKCDKGSVEWNNGPIAVYNPFYLKWEQMNWGWGVLGQPTKNVVDAWVSPQGTTGQVQFFESGDIYLHTSGAYAGKVFEVHGAIYGVYNREGGTGKIGFPITDEIANGPFRHAISYFEGDHCITSQDGIEYQLFGYCKKGGAPTPPKVVDAEGPGCVKGDNNNFSTVSKLLSSESFKPIFEPWSPINYTVNLDPQKIEMPWNNLLMTQDFTINVTTNEFEGEGNTSVTLVNEDAKVSFGFDWNPPFELGDFRIQRIIKVINKFKKRSAEFESLVGVLKKWKTLPGPDPVTKTGWGDVEFDYELPSFYSEYSTLCCSPFELPKFSGNFDMGVEAGLKFYTPRWYVYGLVLRLTVQLAAGADPSARWNTSCQNQNVCIYPNAYFDVGGGVSASVLDPVIARLDLLLGGRASTDDSNICFDLREDEWEPWKIKLCMAPKVFGEAEMFSFIKKKFDFEIGSLKYCCKKDGDNWACSRKR